MAIIDRAASKTATASSVTSAGGGPYTADRAVDGNGATRWASAESEPQWWKVDLGDNYSVSEVQITWEDAWATHYKIMVSTDNSSFTEVADVTLASAGLKVTSFTPVNARYIRIDCITRQTIYGFSFWTVAVMGDTVYAGTVLATSGLVSYWRLEETSGSIVDSKGSNHGTLVGGVTTAQTGLVASEPSSKSMRFDGSTGGVSIPGTSINLAATFSIEAWIQPDVIENVIIFGRPFRWTINLGLNGLSVNNDTSCNYAGGAIPTTTPTHVVGTFDGTNLRLYKDGTLVAGPTAATAATDNTSNLHIAGYDFFGVVYEFDGFIDEVAIYNVALSAGTVAAHFTAGGEITVPSGDEPVSSKLGGVVKKGVFSSKLASVVKTGNIKYRTGGLLYPGAGSGGGNALPYSPPTLTTPTTVALTSGASPRDVTLTAGVDYILTCAAPINGGLRIHGGRNIICRGLHVSVPYIDRASVSDTTFRYGRRGVQFEDYTGHLFIEGLRQDGGDLAEGLTVLSTTTNSMVTIQNYYCSLSTRAIVRWTGGVPASLAPTWRNSYSVGNATYDGMVATEPGVYWDEHSDCYQTWENPHHTRLARCTFITPCQVNSNRADSRGGSVATYAWQDIDVHPLVWHPLGGPASPTYKYYSGNTLSKGQDTDQPEHTFTVQNVWFEPGNAGGTDKTYYTGTYSLGSTAWESDIKLIGVDSGYPGSYVDPDTVGIGYVSPGYA